MFPWKNYLCHLINLNVSHFTIITFSPVFLPPSPPYNATMGLENLWSCIHISYVWMRFQSGFDPIVHAASQRYQRKSCNVQLLYECVTFITVFDTKTFSWLYFDKETVLQYYVFNQLVNKTFFQIFRNEFWCQILL